MVTRPTIATTGKPAAAAAPKPAAAKPAATPAATPRFVYRPRSREQVEARANQSGGMYDSIFKSGVNTIKLNTGANTIRFLPPTWNKPEHYGFDIWIHWNVGPDNGTYLCLAKMKGEHCPICEVQKQFEAEGSKENAAAIRVSKRVAVWLIHRGKEAEGPKLWDMPWTLDRDIGKLSQNRRTGAWLMVDDPDKGFDIDFDREGTPPIIKYTGVAISRDSTPLSDDKDAAQKWLDHVAQNPIPDLLNYYPAEYLERLLSGGGPAPAEEPAAEAEEPAAEVEAEGAGEGGVAEETQVEEPAAEVEEEPQPEPAPAAKPAPAKPAAAKPAAAAAAPTGAALSSGSAAARAALNRLGTTTTSKK